MANELKKALLAAKIDPAWPKLTKNKDGRFKYADLVHILELIEPILGKHGLVVNFEPKERNNIELMITVLSHPESGIEATAESKTRSGKDDKEWGGSCTYQKRYGLMAVLGIAASDDPDPDDTDNIEVLTPEQVIVLQDAIKAHGDTQRDVWRKFLEKAQVKRIEDIYRNGFNEALAFINSLKGIVKQ